MINVVKSETSGTHVFDTRRMLVQELDVLNGLLGGSRLDEENKSRVNAAISRILEELYEDSGEVGLDINDLVDEYNPVRHNIVKEVNENIIEEAISSPTKYYSYDEMTRVMVQSNCKWARKSWDNLLNTEYIYDMPGLGWTKYFTSNSRPDLFKMVAHTYSPTKEDIEAKDWYKL